MEKSAVNVILYQCH